MTREIYNRIAKNSLYNLLLRFLNFPLGLILPPIILGYMGVEGYGVWAFIQVFVNYGGALNSGIDPAVTKYTAEYNAKGDHPKIVRLFNTFLVMYSVLFIVFFIIVLIFHDRIIDVFMRTDKISRADISFALILYAGTFAVKNIYKVYPAFLNGLERMDLTNKVEMLSSACMFVFSIFFLSIGSGIRGLSVASAVSALITMPIYILVCARIAPYLRVNPFLFRLNILSEAKRFLITGFMGGIIYMAHFQLDKLIISYFLGLSYLTYYDLGHKVISTIFGLFGSFISPIMPAASSVYASLGVRKLEEVFEATLKYLMLVSFPVFLFAAVFASKIIFVWLGAGYEEAAFVVRFLSIAYLMLTMTGPGASILTGMGLPEIPFYVGALTAISSVTISLALVVGFGLTGIIVSALAANSLCFILSFYFLQKKLGAHIRDISKSMKFPLITSIIILSILSVTVKYIGNYYIELLLSGALLGVIYLFFSYRNPAYGKLRDLVHRPLFFLTYRS